MDPEFSLAHLMLLEHSPLEIIKIASRTGYQFVSLRLTPVAQGEAVFPLTGNREMLNAVKTCLRDHDIRVLDIELARLGPNEKPEDYIRILETGAELGARHVICQLPDADKFRAAGKFARLCELAKPHGLTIDLEFPSWTETSRLSDAVYYLSQADKPNAGILVDILHFARSTSTIRELKAIPKEWIHFVHLCDASREIPTSLDELIFTARNNRQFPGKGGINVLEIVEAMPRVPYSLEIPNEMLRKELGSEEYARQAIMTAREYLTAPYLMGAAC